MTVSDKELEQIVRRVVRDELARAGSDEFMTITEAALFIRRSPSTIRQWMSTGRLPRHGEGRGSLVKKSELLAAQEWKPTKPSPTTNADIERRVDEILRGQA